MTLGLVQCCFIVEIKVQLDKHLSSKGWKSWKKRIVTWSGCILTSVSTMHWWRSWSKKAVSPSKRRDLGNIWTSHQHPSWIWDHRFIISQRSLPMKQISFTDAEFSSKKRKTRREKFLEEMEVGSGSMGRAWGSDWAPLPQGRQWASALSTLDHAADSCDATLVQHEWPRNGGCTLRDPVDAPLCGAVAIWLHSRRNHHPQVP